MASTTKIEKSEHFNVLTITSPDVENGTGCRVTIWCTGCTHHCKGCHNAHTWAYNQGKSICEKSVLNKIYSEVDKEYIDGITLSGGDPLDQSYQALQELYMFITEFKREFPDKTIWVYTGGLYEDLVQSPITKKILEKIDVLVDGPYDETNTSKTEYPLYRGSFNQRIIYIKNTNGAMVE